MTQSTITTTFRKLAYHVRYLLRIFWDFILLLLNQNLYEITQLSYFLRISELKGMLVIKLVQLFPNLVSILITGPWSRSVPFIPVES